MRMNHSRSSPICRLLVGQHRYRLERAPFARRLDVRKALARVPEHEERVRGTERDVHEHKGYQADPYPRRTEQWRDSVARFLQRLDDPGLAAALGEQPASRVHQE